MSDKLEPGVTSGYLVIHDGAAGVAVPVARLVGPDCGSSYEQAGQAQVVRIVDDTHAEAD